MSSTTVWFGPADPVTTDSTGFGGETTMVSVRMGEASVSCLGSDAAIALAMSALADAAGRLRDEARARVAEAELLRLADAP